MTKDSWGRTYYGDQGSVGQWKVDVISRSDDDNDVVALTPRAWPNYYLYVTKDATGTLGGYKGNPRGDA